MDWERRHRIFWISISDGLFQGEEPYEINDAHACRKNKPTSGVVCPQMWKNGLLDEQTTLEVTFHGKDPKMKKLLTKSIIAAFAIEIIGAAVNLISYAVNGRFLLSKQLYVGEWMGWSGFGMLLNRTFPMSSQDHPVSGSTWISFDPGSLVLTLLGGFVISFIVFGIIRLASKK